jgi:ketosteroid isomerase-like protein
MDEPRDRRRTSDPQNWGYPRDRAGSYGVDIPTNKGLMEMDNMNATLMHKADVALAEGDFAAFLSLHTDDVVMHVPGKSVLAGDHVGRDGLAAVFGQEASMLDAPPEFVALDNLGSADHAVSLVIQRMQRKGRQYEGLQVVLARVRDGCMAEVWFRPEDQDAFDAFFS